MPAKKTITWKQFHTALTDLEKNEAREKIMQACEWSYPTFYAKMSAKKELKSWEKHAVVTAYGKKTEDFFTDKKKKALPL